MNAVNEAFRNWSTLAVFLRLLLAMVAGAIIGSEREFRNRGAGVKTHVLVCIGSAMTMIIAEYIATQMPNYELDITRLGAQVISGIGFLGVGTIIVTGRNEVRGLTTAAGLWASACIGLAAGIGFFTGTVLALLFVLFTFLVLDKIDKHVHRISGAASLYIEFEDNIAVREFISDMHRNDISIGHLNILENRSTGDAIAATTSLRARGRSSTAEVLSAVGESKGVRFFEEI